MSDWFYGKLMIFLVIASGVLFGIGKIAHVSIINFISIICFCLTGVVFLVWLFKKFFLK